MSRFLLMMFSGAVILCAWLVGCDDNERNPAGPVKASDYTVYLTSDFPYSTVTMYHTSTGAIDSFQAPYATTVGPTVSADGKWMYFGSQTTAVIELDSFTTVTELPYDGSGGVVVSPDNQLVAFQGEELYILNTADFSVAYHDASQLVGGRFSADSKNFYCCQPDGDTSFIVKISVIDSTSSWTPFPGEMVQSVIPSANEEKLMLKFWAMFFPLLRFYDVNGDSILFTDTLWDGCSDMELTRDGRFLFCTQLGDRYGLDPPPLAIRVYDVPGNRLHKSINTRISDVPGDPHYWDFDVYDLSLTPDGRLAIGTTRTDYIVIIDLQLMEMAGFLQTDTIYGHSHAICQLMP